MIRIGLVYNFIWKNFNLHSTLIFFCLLVVLLLTYQGHSCSGQMGKQNKRTEATVNCLKEVLANSPDSTLYIGSIGFYLLDCDSVHING